MKNKRIILGVLLMIALVFNTVSFAYADTGLTKDNIDYVVLPGDGGGGHMCEYQNIQHYVSASEALGGNIAVDIFYGAIGACFPASWMSIVGGAIVGNIATFVPAQGDKVIETMTTSYNFNDKGYTFYYHEYVYRGSTLMYEYSYEDTYYPYESSYSIYASNCPH